MVIEGLLPLCRHRTAWPASSQAALALSWGECMRPVIWLNLKRLQWLLISNCYFATKIISFPLTVRTDTWGGRGICPLRFLPSLIWVTLAAPLLCPHGRDGRLLVSLSLSLVSRGHPSALFARGFLLELLRCHRLCSAPLPFPDRLLFSFLLPFSFLALPSTARLCKRFGKFAIFTKRKK